MKVDQILSSGLLELYVLGDLSEKDISLVEEAVANHSIVRQELKKIEHALEHYAFSHQMTPPETVKPLLDSTINFINRLQNGEQPTSPPSLHAGSRIEDYAQWLERSDMQEPDNLDSLYGRIINSDEEKTTLIVWLRDGAPDEVHTDEYEKFLVVEGTCDIKIGDNVHSLQRGDFLSIPLHITHSVTVTSDIPCKVILERAAA